MTSSVEVITLAQLDSALRPRVPSSIVVQTHARRWGHKMLQCSYCRHIASIAQPDALFTGGVVTKNRSRVAAIILAAILMLCWVNPLLAHPHVWVTVKSEFVYAPDGAVTGIRHAWTFDDMFSVFATQGLKQKTKGQFTREELAPLAKVNVESIKEYDFFTFAKANGRKVTFREPPEGYYLAFDAKTSQLTLHFLLPLAKPVKSKELTVEVFDQEYFVEFELAEKDPVKLIDAPSRCKPLIGKPKQMGAELAQQLSRIGADQRNTGIAIGDEFANRITVKCQ